MPITVLGRNYSDYKRMRSLQRMTMSDAQPVPSYVKVMTLFACSVEVIIRCMYPIMYGFEIISLKLPQNVVLLRNCYWNLAYGIATIILAWITDSHVGKLSVIFFGFSIVILGIYLIAMVFALVGVLGNQSVLLYVIYYLGKGFVYTAISLNPVIFTLVLEQFELTNNLRFLETTCMQVVIARHVGEIFFGLCLFVFRKNAYYQEFLMIGFAVSLTFFLFSLFTVKSKLIHHHFKENVIESMVECFMNYGFVTESTLRRSRNRFLGMRASRNTLPGVSGGTFRVPVIHSVDVIEYILTHETIEYTNRVLKLILFLSPFITYFFIAKMIYISWITEGSGLPHWEFVLSSQSIDMVIAVLSIVTILIFEYMIVPWFFMKESSYKMTIKFFTMGFVLLGIALIFVSVIQILTHSQQSFVDVGTLKIHNAMNVSSKIHSQFTGKMTVTPGGTQYVRNIDVQDEYAVCRGKINNERLKWRLGMSHQTIVAKKNDVVIYVITNNGELVRVDDFEPDVNFTTNEMAQLLLINGMYDSPGCELVFNGRTAKGKTVTHQVKMPKMAEQKIFFLEPGSYQVTSEIYNTNFKFTFKAKSYSHIISGDTIIKYDVELPTPVHPIWDIPAMAFYGMSTTLTLIYYLRFIFIQAPPPIRVFCLALLSFEYHIVNIILAFYWGVRKLNFFKADYLVFCGLYCTNIVLFVYVILFVTLNKPYVGPSGKI